MSAFFEGEKMEEFIIKGDYIELNKLLKAVGFCETGGQAKLLIQNELITVNGELETRIRKKIEKGNTVIYQNKEINVR